MASDKQQDLFARLVDQKQLPANSPSPEQLKSQFAALDTSSASEWVERILSLPDKDRTPPPF